MHSFLGRTGRDKKKRNRRRKTPPSFLHKAAAEKRAPCSSLVVIPSRGGVRMPKNEPPKNHEFLFPGKKRCAAKRIFRLFGSSFWVLCFGHYGGEISPQSVQSGGFATVRYFDFFI